MAVEIKENTCFNSDLTDTWSRNLPLRSITFGTNTINFGPKTIDALFTTSESSNIEGDIMPFLLLRSHGQQCISESPANISSILVAFLSKVEEIKQIYLCKESETLYRIWSIVDEDTDQTREKIYEKEMNFE